MITGRLRNLTRDLDTGNQVVQIEVNGDIRETYDELKNEKITVNLKKWSGRRSLDANAYAWQLITQIAERMHEKKNDVYRKAIRESGVCSIHCIPNDQIEEFCKDWELLGLGFQVETFPSQIEGCTNAIFYKGSHLYSTAQMSRLIEGLIQDAEAIGIHTILDEDAKKAIEEWKPRKA